MNIKNSITFEEQVRMEHSNMPNSNFNFCYLEVMFKLDKAGKICPEMRSTAYATSLLMDVCEVVGGGVLVYYMFDSLAFNIIDSYRNCFL